MVHERSGIHFREPGRPDGARRLPAREGVAFENEDPDVVLQAGDRVAHVQIADPARRGFPRDDTAEPRYRRFFDNLRKIGYRGRISVEAESKDLAGDCGPALQFLKRLAAPAGSR